jgi:hypothetical protein
VGSVVERAALGQVLSEYFGFSFQSFIPITAAKSSSFHPRLVEQANE